MTNKLHLVGGVLLICCYFGALLSLWPLSSRDIWVSPDEAATAAFARSYSSTGQLSLPEPLNNEAGGLLGARSMLAQGEVLVPNGFLGLPWLAGSLHSFFGEVVIWLLGPLLGVLGVLAWGDMWRRLVSPRFGVLVGLALALHPAWLLYASRPLMPNVPFVSLGLLSGWLLVWRPKNALATGLAGLLLGLAVMIRVSEVIWLLPVVISLLWLFRTRLSFHSVVALAVGFLLMMGALLGLQAEAYGHAFGTGYTTPPVIETAATIAPPAVEHSWLKIIFPFGFHEWSIMRHTWHYGFLLQWWWSGLALGGAWLLVRSSAARKLTETWSGPTLGLTVIVAGWLAVVYGSWTVFDNPDPQLVTLGNSYARYFLPAFVGASVMVAAVFETLWTRGWRTLSLFLLLVVTSLSFHLVIWGPDGWVHARSLVDHALLKREGILNYTEAEAIIITDRSDKYLLGYRQHLLVPLREASTYQALPALAQLRPVYYFGLTLPPADILHLEETYLQPVGLHLSQIATLDDETLYHIHF